MRRKAAGWVAGLAMGLLTACATGRGVSESSAPLRGPIWPVVTQEHVDLWLHGYALLTRDVAQVPVFRRDYRDSVDALRRRENVLTGLDVNHAKLATLMAQNPEISNGQFLPLYFDSWDQMVQVIHAVLQANGNVGAVDPALQSQAGVVASMFPTAQDREWLRLFTQALGDESQHFFHRYWTDQLRQRAPYVMALDSIWQTLRPKFQRFLTNTRQLNGELVLSLVLGGEGRTLNASPQHNVVVVALPESRSDLYAPIYGFAHEVVQVITNSAIDSNTTVAQQRSGEAGGYAPRAAVRGGAMLLERVAPEFLDGYRRFYLEQAGVAVPPGDPEAAFIAAFPLPTSILATMDREINVDVGGI